MSDPANCGSPGNACTGGVCSGGTCTADCGAGLTRCDGACVDLSSDPLSCGDCGNSCDGNQVCSNGDCRDYRPATGCTTCPCDTACTGDFRSCCPYPGTTDLICIDGACPGAG